MVHTKWSKVTIVGICILTILVLLAESTTGRFGSKKQEVKSRNKREGSWSSWSPWSTCSRSCGGGIRSQTRLCRALRVQPNSKEIIEDSKLWKNVSSKHCEGHSTRHHLCNHEPCPRETVDVRESQCKSFDNRPFLGKIYQWESYVDESSPCSLTCRAKGFRFFTTLSQSVIDGVSCTSSTPEIGFLDLQVCISGVCTSIGCDGIAGSQRRLDRCGVCGGDNSTCRVVSGIFTRPQLPVGYNMVAHIPRGACNLNITQIRRSPNYLALRKNDGSYILNGNWAISWPGEYDGVGAKFRYTRQDVRSLESIASSGPLEEAVDLLVLYQQPNPGIKYEYMMPMNDSPIPPIPPEPSDAQVHHHRHRQLSAATSRPSSSYVPQNTNGGPSQNPVNTISSFPKASEPSLSDQHLHLHQSHHNHGGRRRSHPNPSSSTSNVNAKVESGAGDNKKYYWKLTGYTNCSVLCGGGVQTSLIRCVRGSNGVIVPDRKCNEAEKPTAQTTIRCNLKPCPAEWVIGPWSGCNEACGNGIQTRSVHCQQRVSPTLTMRVSEGACLEILPDSRKTCFIKPCHQWETAAWSQCSATCGNGIRSRSVYCVNAHGEKIQSSDCTEETPSNISACNMGPCEGVDWFFSDWSGECSAGCGPGVQTRSVICSGLDEKYRRRSSETLITSNEIIDNEIGQDDDSARIRQTATFKFSSCDSSTRPVEERQCFSEVQCSEPVWMTSQWSECSVSCGQGLRTRQVFCVQYYLGKFKIVVDSQCASDKPESNSVCSNGRECLSRWFTTEWSECSAICGGGLQKRSASCRNSNWTKLASSCLDFDRPVERRSCNEQLCSSVTSSTTDTSGMVKDTPPVGLHPENHQRHHHYQSGSREATSKHDSLRSNTQSQNVGPTSGSITSLATATNGSQEPNEEPDDSQCTDQYRNCALVVQARLCRYKYYRAVCCISCTDN